MIDGDAKAADQAADGVMGHQPRHGVLRPELVSEAERALRRTSMRCVWNPPFAGSCAICRPSKAARSGGAS